MSSGPPGVAVGNQASNRVNNKVQMAAEDLPTIEQINRALAESGERDRLKSSLKAKLWECGWHEQLKAECQNELKQRGIDRVGPHELANLLGARAKGTLLLDLFTDLVATIPDHVKGQMIQEIELFLEKVIIQRNRHGQQ